MKLAPSICRDNACNMFIRGTRIIVFESRWKEIQNGRRLTLTNQSSLRISMHINKYFIFKAILHQCTVDIAPLRYLLQQMH